MTANADRQKQFRQRMIAAGFVQCNGWVHTHQFAAVQIAMAALKADPDLEIGPLKHAPSGKLTKAKAKT